METSEASDNPPNGQPRPENSAADGGTVGQRFDRISDTAQEAWTRGQDAVRDFKDTLDIDGRVGRNPYGMVAAAVGVGYVLGGGIFSPLTGRLVGLALRMGLRLAAIPFLQRELLGFVEGEEADGDSGDGTGTKGRKAHQAKATNKGR